MNDLDEMADKAVEYVHEGLQRVVKAWSALREEPAPSRWAVGGDFCDCGQVEFPVPGPDRVRLHGGEVVMVHTRGECHVENEEALKNLS